MNDNHEGPPWHQAGWLDAQRTKQISDLSDVAQRAVNQPESLTMGEIQEVSWCFLLMASERSKGLSRPGLTQAEVSAAFHNEQAVALPDALYIPL